MFFSPLNLELYPPNEKSILEKIGLKLGTAYGQIDLFEEFEPELKKDFYSLIPEFNAFAGTGTATATETSGIEDASERNNPSQIFANSSSSGNIISINNNNNNNNNNNSNSNSNNNNNNNDNNNNSNSSNSSNNNNSNNNNNNYLKNIIRPSPSQKKFSSRKIEIAEQRDDDAYPNVSWQLHSWDDLSEWPQGFRKGARFIKVDINFQANLTFCRSQAKYNGDPRGCFVLTHNDPVPQRQYNGTADIIDLLLDPAFLAYTNVKNQWKKKKKNQIKSNQIDINI